MYFKDKHYYIAKIKYFLGMIPVVLLFCVIVLLALVV